MRPPTRATILCIAIAIAASSPRIAIAGSDAPDRGKADPKFVKSSKDTTKELSFDWGLIPQHVEFEGFLDYGNPFQSSATNAPGQTAANVITPNVINQSVFNTRKVMTSVSVFDGATVVLGGLIREDAQSVGSKAVDASAPDLQKLIKERDQLKQRLLEVEALIRKHAKE